MIEELIYLHQQRMSSISETSKRYLYDQIHWDSQAICIHGARGVGKTTMLCQYYQERYNSVEKALYISADNIHVLSNGLLAIASRYFDFGGEALFIDEIHKYPNWSIELKNIIDTFRKKQIIFSGSSPMELKDSKADLSRRVVYYELSGLSLREYLKFINVKDFNKFNLENIINDHVKIAEQFSNLPIMKYFNDYLQHGYYPYFLENNDTYQLKLNNVIEKVIVEDIPSTKNIKPQTIIVLKKLLWLVSTSNCLSPNIDKISKNLGVTRDIIYNGLEYLAQAGLITNIYPQASGMKLIRKPSKIFIDNTNLLHAINGTMKMSSNTGTIRETFLSNQVKINHAIHTHEKADFIIDNEYIIEVGGKNKNQKQIKAFQNAYLALDNINIGIGNRIPLYLFGFLY